MMSVYNMIYYENEIMSEWPRLAFCDDHIQDQEIADWIIKHVQHIAQNWIHVPHEECPHGQSFWCRAGTKRITMVWSLTENCSADFLFKNQFLMTHFYGIGGCWTVSSQRISDSHSLVHITSYL